MDSDNSFCDYKQYNSNQNNSGLLRFRSAPSSFLADFTYGIGKNSAETQGLTSRFTSSSSGVLQSTNQFCSHGLNNFEDNKVKVNNSTNVYALNISQLPPQYPSSTTNEGYIVQNLMGRMDQQEQPNMSSNLMRQNSSPAGLFSNITPQNGYTAIRGIAGYPFSNVTTGDLSPSGMPSNLGMLSIISEAENDTGGTNVPDDEKLGPGFGFGSWNNSSKYAENLSGLKREIDSDQGLFSHNQGGETRNRPHLLSHHLSLPNTSAENAAMEKIMQFQDAIPCKIRAKRGCATHPRSIAERVRRTRISERMRKLQDLVPNMDKQTNTSDMLDLAVEYIKDLQKQYKTLNDIGANCKCSATQKSVSDQMF